MVCKLLLRWQPEDPGNVVAWGGRAGCDPQMLVVVCVSVCVCVCVCVSDRIQHPLQETALPPHFKGNTPSVSQRGHRADTIFFSTRLFIFQSIFFAPGWIETCPPPHQTCILCMFMFAEKHAWSEARHSSPHPVTVRKLVMRIALHFGGRKSYKPLLQL